MRKSTLLITLGIGLMVCGVLCPLAAFVAAYLAPGKFTSVCIIEAASSQKEGGPSPQGGASFLVRLNPPADVDGADGAGKTITPVMVTRAIAVLANRMELYGNSKPVITPVGSDGLFVRVPGIQDAARVAEARRQLEKVTKLEFKLVLPDSAERIKEIEAEKDVIPPGYSMETLSEDRNGRHVVEKLLIQKKAVMDGTHVKIAAPSYGAEGWEVSLVFDAQGEEQFTALTKLVAKNHSQMAIVLDGTVISAPAVSEQYAETGIRGGARISGGFMTEKAARNLAIALENPLQTPLVVEEARGALGDDDAHFIAGQIKILESTSLLLPVINELDLAGKWSRGQSTKLSGDQAYGRLLKMLKISEFRDTDLLTIEVTSVDRQEAADIANTIASRYMQMSRDEMEKQTADSPAKIWDNAVPASRPSSPDVRRVMMVPTGIGFLLVLCGTALFIVGLRAKGRQAAASIQNLKS